MRISSTLLSVLTAGTLLAAVPASAQLVHTIEDHSPNRPYRPAARATPGPTVGPTPAARPSPRVPPPLPPLDASHSAIGNGGLAPAPNIARWRGRDTARVMGRTDLVWYSSGGWRCRRDDGTSGTIMGVKPPNLLYRYARMTGRQPLGKVIAAAPSATFGRAVDTGMILCR